MTANRPRSIALIDLNRPRSIALIDLSYLFKKNWHTPALAGQQLGAAKATLQDLESLSRDVGHLVIARDSKPYFRSDIYPQYKAQRPQPDPDEVLQRRWLYEEIVRLGYSIGAAEGFEADDIIATLAKAYGAWCDDIRIVAADKDAAQCITDNVTQYIPPVGKRDWSVRTPDAVVEKWGVKPDQMAAFQAIAGDSSDGIPGVPLVGETKAKELLQKYGTLAGIYAAMVEAAGVGSKLKIVENFIAHWDNVKTYLKLTTLRTDAPIDAEALLTRRQPEQASEDLYQKARQVYEAQFTQANDKAPESAQTQAREREDLLEAEYDNERSTQGETDPVKSYPGDKAAAPPPRPTRQQRASGTVALVKRAAEYGLVNENLQPMDMASVWQFSEWIVESRLYTKFRTAEQVIVVIARGRELGIGMITALENTHVIDGKPVSHADLIRAMAEKDKSFEYMYPKAQSATACTWVARRKGMPEGAEVPFTYTIDDARKAGLCRSGNYGKPGNWEKRPQDMLNKTAASKLARQLWAAATMGLYCPEEFGYTMEDLEAREAA